MNSILTLIIVAAFFLTAMLLFIKIVGWLVLILVAVGEREKMRCPRCGKYGKEISRIEGEAILEQDRPNQNAPLPMRKPIIVTCKCDACGNTWNRNLKEEIPYSAYDPAGPYGFHTGHTWQ